MVWVSMYDDTGYLLNKAVDNFSVAQDTQVVHTQRDSRELRAEVSSLEIGSRGSSVPSTTRQGWSLWGQSQRSVPQGQPTHK